ncbi:hypothetical protein LEP1GSC123_0739 [Leptospira borgpetersenii str. 200701203]|uniref:Uncharacterized protein n=1 Tax=Leptospira borgpetersenii str. 200701203 TaxID=1193007 RepID=M3FHF3_LEPBO|nr:hypothetical protein LEP1GSC123_0739 [Leptospira borgpetersenii str. 200701203]
MFLCVIVMKFFAKNYVMNIELDFIFSFEKRPITASFVFLRYHLLEENFFHFFEGRFPSFLPKRFCLLSILFLVLNLSIFAEENNNFENEKIPSKTIKEFLMKIFYRIGGCNRIEPGKLGSKMKILPKKARQKRNFTPPILCPWIFIGTVPTVPNPNGEMKSYVGLAIILIKA